MVQAAAQAVAASSAGEVKGQRVATEVRAGLWAAAWAPCPGCRGESVGVMAASEVGGRKEAKGVAPAVRVGEWAGSYPGSIRRTRSLTLRGDHMRPFRRSHSTSNCWRTRRGWSSSFAAMVVVATVAVVREAVV